MNDPRQEPRHWAGSEAQAEPFDVRNMQSVAQGRYDPASILHEAEKIVMGDRQTQYGTPERSFTDIGIVWSVQLGDWVPGTPIPPHTVALMLAGMKLCREKNKPKRDNRVDLVGYALCAEIVSANPVDSDNQRRTHGLG